MDYYCLSCYAEINSSLNTNDFSVRNYLMPV